MLIDAADYVYNAANIAASAVDIQGRIIPTEDVAGQVHPLRRENFAYLCEAISERLGAAYWSCPAKNAPVLSRHIGFIGAQIASLYPASAAAWMNPSASAYERAEAASINDLIETVYAANAITSSDCTIPATVGSALSANYFRHCFYNINRLRTRFNGVSATAGTHGGSVSATLKTKSGSPLLCPMNRALTRLP